MITILGARLVISQQRKPDSDDPIATGRVGKAIEKLREIVTRPPSAVETEHRADEAADLCVKLEPEFENFEAYRPTGNINLWWPAVRNARDELASQYAAVIEVGNPEWSVAAMFRIGQLHALAPEKVFSSNSYSRCEAAYLIEGTVRTASQLHVANKWEMAAAEELSSRCGPDYIPRRDVADFFSTSRYSVSYDGHNVERWDGGKLAWPQSVMEVCEDGGIGFASRVFALTVSGAGVSVTASLDNHCWADINTMDGMVSCGGCD